MQRIEPRLLRGFRDYLPEVMLPREQLMETARRVYRSFGYAPIDTPALEYLEILSGKGGEESDKQMYRFQDGGERWVGLRFDLTVPLARFAAQHAGELGLPFKRYHLGTVWRGENTQRGRYREFMQCDFDAIGSTGAASDIETAQVIHELLLAIGFQRFTIRMNHRGILNGLLQTWGLAERSGSVLRALDKLAKVGENQVLSELTESAGASAEQSQRIVDLARLQGESRQVISQLAEMTKDSPAGSAGVERLTQVLAGAEAAGIPSHRLRVDPSIARGLDYYTGIIFETYLDDLPSIGSVCSGGRYDNLAALFTKEELPGIGASLGLDRLIAAMEELKLLPTARTPAQVLVAYFAADRLHDYIRLASALRQTGIAAELYPDAKKLGAQLKYADRKGFRVAVIAGEDELQRGVCQVKDLKTGESREAPLTDAAILAKVVREVLNQRDDTPIRNA